MNKFYKERKILWTKPKEEFATCFSLTDKNSEQCLTSVLEKD